MADENLAQFREEDRSHPAQIDQAMCFSQSNSACGSFGQKGLAELSIAVKADVLDRLTTLVSDLALTRNRLLQLVRSDGDSKYSGPISRLNRITTDLQEGIMQIRMQPIGEAATEENAFDELCADDSPIPADFDCSDRNSADDGLRVLVIDDSRFFRHLARVALESYGYQPTVVESAERAIDLIEKDETFDAILCDVEMPGMDGYQFAEWCRSCPVTRDMPLVAMTSLDLDLHGPRMLRSGFDRLIEKFHPQSLRDALRELLPNQSHHLIGIGA